MWIAACTAFVRSFLRSNGSITWSRQIIYSMIRLVMFGYLIRGQLSQHLRYWSRQNHALQSIDLALSWILTHEKKQIPLKETLSLLDGRLKGSQGACSSIWPTGTLAYRCKTCQRTDFSSICYDCFKVSMWGKSMGRCIALSPGVQVASLVMHKLRRRSLQCQYELATAWPLD